MSYDVPTAAAFIVRHPRFAAVAEGTITAYLAEASRTVTTAWSEGDYADGIMYLAAHEMVMEGAIDPTGVALGVGNQVKRTKAGSVEIEFDTAAQLAGNSGQLWATYGATIYGKKYLDLAARNGGQSDAAVLVV